MFDCIYHYLFLKLKCLFAWTWFHNSLIKSSIYCNDFTSELKCIRCLTNQYLGGFFLLISDNQYTL